METWERGVQTRAEARLVQVKARLFARLREEAKTAEVDVALPRGGTVEDVYLRLVHSHPGLDSDRSHIRPCRNQAICAWGEPVSDGDEIAFIPPVSGGAVSEPLIEVTPAPLDARRLEAAVAHAGAGAICTFTGVVRDRSHSHQVTHLEYEAYAGMAGAEMRKIADEISARWQQARVSMAHRVGTLAVGEASVVVCVSAPHRAEAFEACRWGIDRLKESVPIWKKEFTENGSYWVEGTHDA